MKNWARDVLTKVCCLGIWGMQVNPIIFLGFYKKMMWSDDCAAAQWGNKIYGRIIFLLDHLEGYITCQFLNVHSLVVRGKQKEVEGVNCIL